MDTLLEKSLKCLLSALNCDTYLEFRAECMNGFLSLIVEEEEKEKNRSG